MSGSEVAGHVEGRTTMQFAKIIMAVVATIAAGWVAMLMKRSSATNGQLAGLACTWKIECPKCKKTKWTSIFNKKVVKEQY